jgi:AraC-like DNA-binding protein
MWGGKMEININDLRDEIRKLFMNDGDCITNIPYVTAYRFTEEKIQMPKTNNSYLYMVVAGALRLYTPSGIMDYMAGQYSVSKIDTPLSGTVLAFSEKRDFLAVSIEFTVNDVITLVLDMDNSLTEKIVNGDMKERDIEASDKAVVESVYRLFYSMQRKIASEFLRKNIFREMIYYILCGSCGRQFLQSIINIGKVDEIYEANSWIKENFRDAFTVEDLAVQKNMSVSLFHQKFKEAVGMGLLQCQKRLRLTEARRLMLDDSKNVTEASVEVGYESLSQFIRDYRKMFGSTPKEDILNIQEHLKK